MMVRREIAESRCETCARSREDPKRTRAVRGGSEGRARRTTKSPVAFWAGSFVSSACMDLSQLSQDQFKELLRGIVDDRLRELLGDPELGLQLGDGLRVRLKESLARREFLSGEDIADRLGLRW